jgi:crotonobetaine/carnitine-CoA ligase
MILVDDITLRHHLEIRAKTDEKEIFCYFEDAKITFGDLEKRVNQLANGLLRLGLRPGDRVAVMLPNHPDYIYTMYALAKLGAVFVPVNVALKGDSLDLLLELSDPRAIIADPMYLDSLREILPRHRSIEILVWRGDGGEGGPPVHGQGTIDALCRSSSNEPPPVPGPGPDDCLLLCFTSGTTGVPKGVPLSDRMWRACGMGCGAVSTARRGDVMLLWEPFYHIGGSEVCHHCIMQGITIALLSRFSASHFWEEVRRYKATHIHFLGGIIPILLSQPPRPDDRNHTVRIAWGGGCTAEAWRPFEERFGVTIHECYGMTECCSMTTVNTEGKLGSIGKPLDYFEVKIAEENGRTLGPNEFGEIQVRTRQPGLIMREYFRNPEATRAAMRPDGWFGTGDLGSMDEEGYLYFRGRTKDCIRRGGENISAWEVERVINKHPDVEECALVGIKSEIGLDDLKVFLKIVPDHPQPDPAQFIKWCEAKMPKFHVPRYVAFIEAFDKTGSQRIKKEGLPRSTTDCWDRKAIV